ncbi:methyl-accepting chemotaxis protein [Paracidovorax avenae]|uniref:methyl-accepting chemotaxis protein n=1 Tax=Paracidovorax avenae TaxID=80867 RepID=UPI000D1655EB|nr:methyl-accepting chemotaxis protein [Paracidovorax avenae]AVS88822.1 methyl-accepting chemotaxis protein [Paracidovorax avenae]
MRKATMTVKNQLSIAFGALVVMVLIVSVLSLHSLGNANQTFTGYVQGINAQSDLASGLRSAVNRRAIAVRNLVLVTERQEADKEQALVLKADEDVQKNLAGLKEAVEQDRAAPGSTRQLLGELEQIEAVYGPVARDIVKMAVAGQRDAAVTKINNECRPLLAQLTGKTGDFVTDAGKRAAATEAAAAESFVRQRNILLAACLAAVAMAIVSGVIITRRLSSALGAEPSELGWAAQRVAEGDLAPLGEAGGVAAGSVMASIASMQSSLARIVTQVRSASDSIAIGSTEIATGAGDLSMRTEQQASALQQTSATMDELSSTVRHNADNALQANQLAQGATGVAQQGGDAVNQVVTTMREINESSRRISDIIGVIDGIAFQTNILALNAAVEAARAGEQGRGFAVVASEVRSLAQRSAQAAREIKTLITDSVTQVEAGTALVDRAGQTMGEVVASIKRVSDIVGEISAASSEQSHGVSQVGVAVNHMDEATQQNAALVEQSSAAAKSLQQQAQDLVQAVSIFKLQPQHAALPQPMQFAALQA